MKSDIFKPTRLCTTSPSFLFYSPSLLAALAVCVVHHRNADCLFHQLDATTAEQHWMVEYGPCCVDRSCSAGCCILQLHCQLAKQTINE